MSNHQDGGCCRRVAQNHLADQSWLAPVAQGATFRLPNAVEIAARAFTLPMRFAHCFSPIVPLNVAGRLMRVVLEIRTWQRPDVAAAHFTLLWSKGCDWVMGGWPRSAGQ